jgi:hypothetical protein
VPAGGTTVASDLSGNNRVIVFFSTAKNLVRGARSSAPRDFVYELAKQRTRLLPVQPSTESDVLPAIDHDGSRIAFVFDGPVAGLSGDHPVVGRYDRVSSQITRMMGRRPAGALTTSVPIAINATGRRVGFTSRGSLDPTRPSDFHSTYVATG